MASFRNQDIGWCYIAMTNPRLMQIGKNLRCTIDDIGDQMLWERTVIPNQRIQTHAIDKLHEQVNPVMTAYTVMHFHEV